MGNSSSPGVVKSIVGAVDRSSARKHKERQTKQQQQYDLEKLKLEQAQKQQEIEAQAQQHKEELKRIAIDAKVTDRANKEKQRNDAIQRIQNTVAVITKQTDTDQKELTDVIKARKLVEETLKTQDEKIKTFDKNGKLKDLKKEMDDSERQYKHNDDEIIAAIGKTGQDEDNIGRFLRLTKGLIGQTTESQANVNKLEAEINTFFVMMERQCQDKLSIEYYFQQNNLTRFVPMLQNRGITFCQNLSRNNVDLFNEDILNYIEGEIGKEIDEWNKRHPNEQDPFEVFLEAYKLQKFKKGLEDAGLSSLDDITEDLGAEMIDELISEANIKGLHKMKFKKAINEVKTGKYKAPERPTLVLSETNNNDEEKRDEPDGKDEKPREMTDQEKADLRQISTQPLDTWKPYEKEKAALTKAALLEISPILREFFGEMYRAVKQAQKLLEMPNSTNGQLNDEQIQVMNALMDNTEQKSIELKDVKPTTDIRLNNGGPFDMKYMEGSNWPFGTVSSASTQDTQESKLSFTIAGQYQYGDDIISFAISLDDEGEILLSVIRGKYSEALDKLQAGPSRISGSSWEATMKTFKPCSDDAKYGVSIIIDAPKDSDNTAPDTEDNKEEDKIDPTLLHDYEQRKVWKEGSATQVYSKTKNKWYNGKIIEIANDEEGEWLTIEYMTDKDKRTKQVDRFGKDVRDPLTMECYAIAKAVVDVNVVSLFQDQFQESETTKCVEPVSKGIEESVKAILKCQSQIRQSVRLAGSLLDLKPANLTDTSKPLWAAVDDGIINIIKSALEMDKISAQYFGYFLRFNSSFQKYISMNEQNKEVSLFTSLEHIKQDMSDFSDFTKEFNKRLAGLSDESLNVIKRCVDRHIGAEQFEKARILKEQFKNKYLTNRGEYQKEKLKLDLELEGLETQRATDRANEAKLKYRQKTLEEAIKRNEGYIKDYREKESELNALNFDAGFEDSK